MLGTEHRSTREGQELALQWYRMCTDIPHDAFKLWALVTLKAQLPFDGAVWGRWTDAPDARPRLVGAHRHRLDHDEIDDVAAACLEGSSTGLPQGRAMRLSASPARHGHGRHRHLLALRSVDAHLPQPQAVVLTRAVDTGPFDARDAAWFEAIGAHLMQAYSISTKTLIRERGAPLLSGASLVDASGTVHEHDDAFDDLMRREWPGWRGGTLPDALRDPMARHAQCGWRHLGEHVCVTGVKVHRQTMLSIRPRGARDALTPRELEIARQYGAGMSFREIAAMLHLAPATVRAHLRKVFAKLQVHNKSRLATLLDVHA